MTILVLILTILNTLNVLYPMPLWYRIGMLVFSAVALGIAIKQRNKK